GQTHRVTYLRAGDRRLVVGRDGGRRREIGEYAEVEDEHVGDVLGDAELLERGRGHDRRDDVGGGGRQPGAEHERGDHGQQKRAEQAAAREPDDARGQLEPETGGGDDADDDADGG